VSIRIPSLSLVCLIFLVLLCLPSGKMIAQNSGTNLGEIHGNFQMDMQYYNPDSTIKAPPVPEKTGMNGFLNLNYTRDKFSAGLRYESYLSALQGFDPRYKGSGILYRYVSYTSDELQVTVGSFYEQFGNGLILRAYEDRGLGYDNALEGLRVKLHPYKGIYIKGVYGLQRSFMTYGPGTVRGVDAEINFNELFEKLTNKKTNVILGGGFVSKFQADAGTGAYIVPQNVGAWAERLNIHRGKVNIQAEYAYKINDPSFTNGYIYKPGEALFVSASYSQKGFGFSLSGKRIDNMDFRSDRSASLNNLEINYLPCLTRQYTYSMLTFYPDATQNTGEIGYQAEMTYKIKKGTLLGGEYGANVLINFATVSGLDTNRLNPASDSARKGYSNKSYFGFGQKYFEDFNIEIDKKLSQHCKLIAIYSYQTYNKAVLQGEPSDHTIYSQIGVADIVYRFTDTLSIRFELEHLYTKQDMGAWASGLVEFTVAPKWFVAASDQWNYGNADPTARIHYYNGTIGYIRKTNRYQISYGKQRAGIYCVGGVCRTVPASNGLTLTLISSF
jgi:hypothetical protein